MDLRYARNTIDLAKMETFYTEIVGLSRLSGFTNHSGYDGVILGLPGYGWQLEFTCSAGIPQHVPDEDDLLVFYVYSAVEMALVKKRIGLAGIQPVQPVNPYWTINGIMISDPDGYRIVFAFRDKLLNNTDALTMSVNKHGIETWDKLLHVVRQLPYGRNQNREDFSLVLAEQKGTCSSKHALLKRVAEVNGVPGVKLLIGMYKMNRYNTPLIGSIVEDHGLPYIPEAHCYLMIQNQRIDITTTEAAIGELLKDVLFETEIEAEQVNEFKVQFHQNYLKRWLADQGNPMTPEVLWTIREQCIQRLSANQV